ncbi:MAG: hypothetical protein ACYDD4_13485 [Acidimicrobiales bacterium]
MARGRRRPSIGGRGALPQSDEKFATPAVGAGLLVVAAGSVVRAFAG